MIKERKLISYNSISMFSMFAFICILLFGLFGLLAPVHYEIAYYAYFRLFVVATAVIFFYRKGYMGKTEVRLFLAYLGWLLITRWLNKDYYLISDMKLVNEVLLSFLMFSASSMLDEGQRDKLLSWLIAVFGVFFFAIALMGLFVAVTNTSLSIPPEHTVRIYISDTELNSLVLLSTDRHICARWIYFAWSLLVYAFFRYKNAFIRVITVIGIIVFHITIPLFHARSIQIVQSVSCAMLAVICGRSVLAKKANAIRIPAVAFAAAAAAALCFMSSNWINILVTDIRAEYAPRFESYYTESGLETYDSSIAIDSGNAEADMTDKRKITGNWSLTGRTFIWKSGIIALKRDPAGALIGNLSNGYMDTVNKIYSEEVNPADRQYKFHMHSAFMQVLMQTGIPGMILMTFWIVLVSVKTLIVFFSKRENVPLALKALTAPLIGIIIWHIAEPGIFGIDDISGHAFFLVAGVFIGFYNDVFCRSDQSETAKSE